MKLISSRQLNRNELSNFGSSGGVTVICILGLSLFIKAELAYTRCRRKFDHFLGTLVTGNSGRWRLPPNPTRSLSTYV